MLLKGFFWKYVKVWMSFGKLMIIKERGQVIDKFYVGEIKDGFLYYKKRMEGVKFPARIAIDNNANRAIYRCLQCAWIDIDEDNRICTIDYSVVPGFDAKKYSDLYVMAEQQPEIGDNKQLIMFFALGIVIVLVIVAIYFGYVNYDSIKTLSINLPQICKGVVTAGA
jgi:hypothetical protein